MKDKREEGRHSQGKLYTWQQFWHLSKRGEKKGGLVGRASHYIG